MSSGFLPSVAFYYKMTSKVSLDGLKSASKTPWCFSLQAQNSTFVFFYWFTQSYWINSELAGFRTLSKKNRLNNVCCFWCSIPLPSTNLQVQTISLSVRALPQQQVECVIVFYPDFHDGWLHRELKKYLRNVQSTYRFDQN